MESKCEYCSDTNIIIYKETTELRGIGDLGEGGYLEKEIINLIYDSRGYLRLVNDDYACLDHGENIKANYCFNCGREI